MKELSESLKTEKAKSQVEVYYLLDIGSYHYTDRPEGISYGGNTYIYFPFSFDGISGSEDGPLADAVFELGNANNVMSAIILNNSLKEATVLLREIYYDSLGVVVDLETLFYGKVSGSPACTEELATVNVVPYRNPWSAKCPRRRISKHCGWKFKDADCGYTGAITSCNKTWVACDAMSNTARFGGFRFLPAKGTQFIYGSKVIKIR